LVPSCFTDFYSSSFLDFLATQWRSPRSEQAAGWLLKSAEQGYAGDGVYQALKGAIFGSTILLGHEQLKKQTKRSAGSVYHEARRNIHSPSRFRPVQ
jgi:hypothetical protein